MTRNCRQPIKSLKSCGVVIEVPFVSTTALFGEGSDNVEVVTESRIHYKKSYVIGRSCDDTLKPV